MGDAGGDGCWPGRPLTEEENGRGHLRTRQAVQQSRVSTGWVQAAVEKAAVEPPRLADESQVTGERQVEASADGGPLTVAIVGSGERPAWVNPS